MPHIATQKKVHQNSVTYIPPTPAYHDEDFEGREGTRLACQRTEGLSVKGRTCGTRIALVAAVTVHCSVWAWMSWEITSIGGTLAISLGHPGAGQKKKISPNSLTTSELKQAVRGSS